MSSSSSDDGDDFHQFTYNIVEFVKRGKASLRAIDIVPMKWLTYNYKKKYMEAKFHPPPYNDQTFKEIQKLIENNVDAPADWPSYHVLVIARGRDYIDALKKLKLAQDQRYAFTTETDVEPEQNAAEFEIKFKQKNLLKQTEEMKSLMAVQPIEPKDKKIRKKRHINLSSCQPNKKNPKIITEKDLCTNIVLNNDCFMIYNTNLNFNKIPYLIIIILNLADNQENWNDQQSITIQKPSNVSEVSICPESSSNILFDMLTPVLNKNCTTNVDDILVFDPKDVNTSLLCMNNVFTEEVTYKNSQNSKQIVQDKKQTKYSQEHVEVMKAIEGINSVLKQVLDNQGILINLWEASRWLKSPPQSFEEKYAINLPFASIEDFNTFNDLLKNNDCWTDFISSLYSLMDRRRNFVKTILNILKKFMSRDVAIKFTAQKQCADKLVLKEFIFCKAIIEFVTHKFTNDKNQPLTEKEIMNGICYVLSNAKDWDGHRMKRLSQD